jgi:hypothetical protein
MEVEVEKPWDRPAEPARLAAQHHLHDMTGDHASEVQAPQNRARPGRRGVPNGCPPGPLRWNRLSQSGSHRLDAGVTEGR